MPQGTGKKHGPVANPEERRVYRFNVYFNYDELTRFENTLAAPGFAVAIARAGSGARRGQRDASSYMRSCATGQRTLRPVPKLNKQMCAVLARLSKNVSDIVDSIETKFLDTTQKEMVDHIFAEIKELSAALVAVRVIAPDLDNFNDFLPSVFHDSIGL